MNREIFNDTITATNTHSITNAINTITRADNLWKVPLPAGSKAAPPRGWQKPENGHRSKTRSGRGNYGIVTGTRNHTIVLDIDLKDDGLAEFKTYIDKHGDPNIYTV